MRAYELIDLLNSFAPPQVDTWDTVKAGDASKQIKKVAVSMFATVETIKRVKEWGEVYCR